MNTFPSSAFWLHTLAALALQVTVALAAALGLHLFVKSARGRQVLWPASFLGLALVLVNFLTGIDRQVAGWITTVSRGDGPQFVVRGNLEPTGFAMRRSEAPGAEVAPVGDRLSAAPVTGPSTTWWPGWLWLTGIVVLGARTLGFRLWLVRFSRRNEVVVEPETQQRVQALAARLGLNRRVRLIELPALDSPIAFGWLRPTVGLPAGFWTAHSRREQDAMLAHELAHLAARDPLWQMLADTVSVVLWWHPAVWWARRQLREASETAADEASLLVEDGPSTLAACLVALASRMQSRRTQGLLRMTGLRSGLGRRVERLLGFERRDYPRFRKRTAVFVLVGGTGLGVGLALAATALVIEGGAGQPTLIALARQAVTASPTPGTEAAKNVSSTQPTGSESPPTMGSATKGARQVSTVTQGTPLNVPGNPEAEARPADRARGDSTNGTTVSPDLTAATSAATLRTRLFKFDPNAVLDRLGSDADRNYVGTPPLEALLRRYLASAGVDFREDGSAAGSTRGPSQPSIIGRALSYDPHQGVLAVRATLADLDVVETALQIFNPPSAQITIETRFVEVPREAAQKLENDQALASELAAAASNSPGASNAPITMAGILGGSQLSASTALGGGTNLARELRGDEIDWPGRPATNAHDLRLTAILGPLSTNVLSDAQFRTIMRVLPRYGGVDVLTTPSVTTLSGRAAEIQVTEVRNIVAAVNPQAVVRPGGADPGTNVSPYLTATVPMGPTLRVLPVLQPAGDYIDLDVTPAVAEFMGYDAPRTGGKVRVWVDGEEKSVDQPLPRVRLRQARVQARVQDGQTLVLSGWTSESILKFKDKVPVLSDLPLLGALFRSEGQVSQTKTLLVFVTVVLVDPAGHRIHAVDTPSKVAR